MGGDAIFADLQEHLGVGNDETTADGKVTPGAHRVQRGLRLRAGGDGQLGVLRQQDPDSAPGRWSTACAAGADVAPTRGAPRLCTWKRGRPDPGRLPRRPGGRRAHRRRSRPWPACGSPGSTAGRPTQRLMPATDAGDARQGAPSDLGADPGAHRALGRARLLHAGGLPSATAATRRCPRRWPWSPTRSSQMVKDSGLRGRGGAGFPTGTEVGLHPAGRRQAALPGGQRRRVGAGHLQGHPAAAGHPARADRGHHHRRVRDPGEPARSSTCAARCCT